MEILALSALLAVMGVGALRWRLADRIATLHRLRNDVGLIPNRLLTRYPIVLLGARSSLLFPGSGWGAIPRDLAEHGYTILELDAPLNAAAENRIRAIPFDHHLVIHPDLAQHIRLDRIRLLSKASQSVTKAPVEASDPTPLIKWLSLGQRAVGTIGLSAGDLGKAHALVYELAESDYINGRNRSTLETVK